MRQFWTFLGLGLALLWVGGCATTEFKSTWKDPAAGTVDFRGKRVAAFVVTKSDAQRRSAEDALAQELAKRGVSAIPGYQIWPGPEPADKEVLRKALADQNIDGVVVMRVVDRRQEVNYVPGGPAYGSFYGYWDYGWSTVGNPGYLSTETILSVETLVYTVAGDERTGIPADKLLWGGVSETFDPGKFDKVVKEIVDKASDEMKKAGLIHTE
jgi:hypothetical protein